MTWAYTLWTENNWYRYSTGTAESAEDALAQVRLQMKGLPMLHADLSFDGQVLATFSYNALFSKENSELGSSSINV